MIDHPLLKIIILILLARTNLSSRVPFIEGLSLGSSWAVSGSNSQLIRQARGAQIWTLIQVLHQ